MNTIVSEHLANITSIQFYPGATAGLSVKTALVELEFGHEPEHWDAESSGLPGKIFTLRPGEPLYGFKDGPWPGAFVADLNGSPGYAHWVVALTISMQLWARDPVWQGRVLMVQGKRARLALPWERKDVLLDALKFALRHLYLWSQPLPGAEHVAHVALSFDNWLKKVQPGGLSPNTHRFAIAAAQRNIPFSVKGGILFLGWGSLQQRLDSSYTGKTSHIATRIARIKNLTSQMLLGAGLPVPPTGLAANWESARALAAKFGWPVVVKPANQDQGIGVVPGIRNEALLRKAYEAAARFSPGSVIIEKHIEGADHRLLVVNGVLMMAARRIPGGVIGDGRNTVSRLIEAVNADPLRGSSKRSVLISLALDEEALDCLIEQDLTLDAIPPAGRFVRLRRTANISTGGTAEDVLASIHPDNRSLAVRAARIIGLDIAGVDFLCPDISRSWREVGGAICEVNAQPGFRPHWLSAPEKDINGEIIDGLFSGKSSRVPTAAITGTNGKSTVARMLHHIWQTSGRVAGVCTTNGVWVGNELIVDTNLSGYPGGRILLNDPAVESVVIEMPRKGLILFGHPCDSYDVSVMLNIQDDHIGVDGIESLEQMVQLKSEVLERARQAVIVNADDELCLAACKAATAPRRILVSRDGSNSAVQAHRAQGGDAVFIQLHRSAPWVLLAEGVAETPLMPLHDIPATMSGLLHFNETNALFAAATGWAQGVATSTIRSALSSFANTPEQNPGRYNMIAGFPFQVLLDYGHNPDGVSELCAVVQSLEVRGKRRLLNLKLGNRHKAHLQEMAPLLARTFDTFLFGCDVNYVKKCKDYAGTDPEGAMLTASINALQDAGVPAKNMTAERDRKKAIRMAIDSARKGDLLVLLAEPWEALAILDAMRPSSV